MSKAAEALKIAWAAEWENALALWSRYTRLRLPALCVTHAQAEAEGLSASFAMIRLADQTVVIDLQEVHRRGLDDFPLEILAHEIGHHIYCPADLTDQGRLIARMRRALYGREEHADALANIYADLLINDRLQRQSAGNPLRMDAIYQKLNEDAKLDGLWLLFMRILEILWKLPRGQLAAGPIDERMDSDAYLGARLIRSYARSWLDGAGRFAVLCLPYLMEQQQVKTLSGLKGWRDTQHAGAGGMPIGLTEIEGDEITGAIHPALDPELSGVEMEDDTEGEGKEKARPKDTPAEKSQGQYREPFEYGAILKSLGLKLTDHDIAVRYYRERAAPYLVPFPTRVMPETTDPLPEGLEPWDIGSPVEAVDWVESVTYSPHIIPGVTTLQRTWGVAEGGQPARQPLDLDLYVDCSGSMPNPQQNISYPALAGAIIAISALRSGARVQATLWSGAREFQTTPGFVRDEDAILRILTGYLGGGTAFPIHMLRDTYLGDRPRNRPTHILVISDSGVTTMYDKDELGNSGWTVAEMALEAAGGGGTMVLEVFAGWLEYPEMKRSREIGWDTYSVEDMSELVAFARAFARKKYGQG
ncbi:MAG TPA: vWA domain-containing protein [Anaerolineaceae bacterium]|nr:vWA domain-containing protein [Anaerolineaceae bacterium]HPN52801.1 vWA domain-containing protein [Anaerolineaceae bacterium]